LSLNAPNAVFQESVRAMYTGWYKEVVNNLPRVEQGMISVSDQPGLGMSLMPDLARRKDASVRISKLNK
jgi:L-alanine-DL-glutamate epimerase-like enolase superfamily enzyme